LPLPGRLRLSHRPFEPDAPPWYGAAAVLRVSRICLVAAALGPIMCPRPARGDVTSWLAVGGGATVQRNRLSATSDLAPALTYSLGVGSSPTSPVVIGGLARGTTYFGLGTDVGLAARISTGGFARGDWGVALDAGAVWRPWRSGVYGEWPLQGVVTVAAPWGLQIGAGAELSSASGGRPAQGFFAALEIDLLRLTVMRQGSTERWWYNPAPAGGHL
jgi:hypothetical protein